MARGKQTSYRSKFGDPPSKYHYGFKKCEHNNSHVEKMNGVRYECCNACNTVLDNELNARLQNRVFVGSPGLAQAA